MLQLAERFAPLLTDILQYAIEHGLPVMKPSWITDVHASWLSGDDPMGEDQESIDPWRLQPFEGLKITISGFENREPPSLTP